MQVNTWQASS